MGTKVHFFSGNRCVSFDRGQDRAFFSFDEAPSTAITNRWSGLAEAGFATDIDAAVNWGNGKLFLFKGPMYVRFDILSRSVDAGYPLPIGAQWPGMTAAGFDSGLDAAVNWGNGKAFFFKGDRYVRYDIAADKVDDGYPLPIAGQWPGFAEANFASDIDAVVPWGNGKAYAFSGNRYLRYDMIDDKTDPGYPLIIADHWTGMSDEGFGAGLRGGCDLPPPSDLWLPDAQKILCPVAGPKFLGLPWRGVLHTTEGGSIPTVVQTYMAHNNDFPHFTIDPRAMAVAQHFPLNAGARALEDKITPDNASNSIQIEICEFAQNAPNWPPEFQAFIKSVMMDIEERVPIARSTDVTFIPFPASAADAAANRLTPAAWRRYAGWCGHQHIPGNSHGDPGAIDIDFLLN